MIPSSCFCFSFLYDIFLLITVICLSVISYYCSLLSPLTFFFCSRLFHSFYIFLYFSFSFLITHFLFFPNFLLLSFVFYTFLQVVPFLYRLTLDQFPLFFSQFVPLKRHHSFHPFINSYDLFSLPLFSPLPGPSIPVSFSTPPFSSPIYFFTSDNLQGVTFVKILATQFCWELLQFLASVGVCTSYFYLFELTFEIAFESEVLSFVMLSSRRKFFTPCEIGLVIFPKRFSFAFNFFLQK